MSLISIQKHLHNILSNRVLFYCTPLNLSSEKKKFFTALSKGKTYNPQFRYRKILFDEKQAMKEIRYLVSYDNKNKQIRKIVREYGRRLEIMLCLIKNIGRPKFTYYSTLLYGLPDNQQLSHVMAALRTPVKKTKHNAKTYDAAYAIKKLKSSVEKYGWKIRYVANHPVRMSCVNSKKELLVLKGSKFTLDEIKRLKYHEIEVHIRRAYNNEKLPPEIRYCFDYIGTEEGLALKMEELNGLLSPFLLKKCAAYHLAIRHSIKNSFFDVFQLLKSYGFGNNMAFSMTVRCKRGLKDTSKLGAFTKDHVYFSGKMKIDRFLKSGGKLEDLFIGKIDVKNIGLIKEIVK